MQDAFEKFAVKNSEDFEREELCQLSIGMLVINVYELTKKIDEDFYVTIPRFISLRRRLKLSRNIASHDYESLDLDIIYKLIVSLTNSEILEELESVLNEPRNN